MPEFLPGKTYLFFDLMHARGGARRTLRELTYIGRAPAAVNGGLELFRCATATWKESFTPIQLADFSITAAAEEEKRGEKKGKRRS